MSIIEFVAVFFFLSVSGGFFPRDNIAFFGLFKPMFYYTLGLVFGCFVALFFSSPDMLHDVYMGFICAILEGLSLFLMSLRFLYLYRIGLGVCLLLCSLNLGWGTWVGGTTDDIILATYKIHAQSNIHSTHDWLGLCGTTGYDKRCKYLHRELDIVVFKDWLDRRGVFLLGPRDGALPYVYCQYSRCKCKDEND